MAKVKRPPVGINPNIQKETQRELRKVAGFAFDAQDNVNVALESLNGKVGKNRADLLQVSQFVSKQIQAGGQFPISLQNLTGVPAQAGPLEPIGSGGTFVTGAKITSGGQEGKITIDEYGRVTAIQQAT